MNIVGMLSSSMSHIKIQDITTPLMKNKQSAVTVKDIIYLLSFFWGKWLK